MRVLVATLPAVLLLALPAPTLGAEAVHGQLIVGFSVSFTVTLKLQVSTLSWMSITV